MAAITTMRANVTTLGNPFSSWASNSARSHFVDWFDRATLDFGV